MLLDLLMLIAGPPCTRTRLDQSLEVFFPRSSTNKWRFFWKGMEIGGARPTQVLGHCVTTTEVLHYCGAPSTAIVLSDGDKRFAYSGDTEWWTRSSPPAPIFFGSNASPIPANCPAISAGTCSSRGCRTCARGGSCLPI